MKKVLVLFLFIAVAGTGLTACGKKSDPVLRDENGKVVSGRTFPPPYDAQVSN